LPANWWRVACRNEEHAADRHAVEILRRTRYSKDDLVDALTGSAGFRLGRGGFLSTTLRSMSGSRRFNGFVNPFFR
jgi:hypothetical protein